jgi:hypothetical protein
MWRACKRRYYNTYVQGGATMQREATTPNMAAGTWLCQAPIEQFHDPAMIYNDWTGTFAANWQNFLAEFEGDDTYDDPIFTPDLPKRILAAYKKAPLEGKVVSIEERFVITWPGGFRYSSKPDFVVEDERGDERGNLYMHRTALDIKLKTFKQTGTGKSIWPKEPYINQLSPWNDQGMGQAVLADCDSFGQVQFYVGQKDGHLHGPIYVEQHVNPTLADEWERETVATIRDIEAWRASLDAGQPQPWPKNEQACHMYGKPCAWMQHCGFGFVVRK